MNPRLKDYDATGVAPNGRLFSGDLNLLQDTIPRLIDYAQNMGVASLAVGEAGLTLTRFGAGEVALSGAMRLTGLLRALGGVIPPTYTTTARDAIPAGSRPYGMVILNTTKNAIEFNANTDASPVWQQLYTGTLGTNGQVLSSTGTALAWTTLTTVEPGTITDFAGPEANIPSGYLPCDGRILAQATYPALYARIGTTWDLFGGQSAPGTGNFRLPKLNGLNRVTKKDMGGQSPVTGGITRAAAATLAAVFGEEFHALLTAEMPSHSHAGVTGGQSADHTHAGTTGTQSVDHTHGGTTAGRNAGHVHFDAGHVHGLHGTFNPSAGGSAIEGTADPGGTLNNTDTGYASLGGESADHAHGFTTGGVSASHTHTITTGGVSVGHTHAISAEGGGGVHENCLPSAVVITIIKT